MKKPRILNDANRRRPWEIIAKEGGITASLQVISDALEQAGFPVIVPVATSSSAPVKRIYLSFQTPKIAFGRETQQSSASVASSKSSRAVVNDTPVDETVLSWLAPESSSRVMGQG